MRFAQWLLEGHLDGDHLINHVAMIALMDSVNDTFSHIIYRIHQGNHCYVVDQMIAVKAHL
jgi:hypothetical protein